MKATTHIRTVLSAGRSQVLGLGTTVRRPVRRIAVVPTGR